MSKNDQRSVVKNPNNPAYKEDRDCKAGTKAPMPAQPN